jgi:ParB family transcriptional regulator, chromosome partitioning protein
MSSRRGMGSAGATLRRPAVEARRTDGDPSLVSALAGSPTEAGQALRMVQVAEVAEHPHNPRDTLGDLTELAASIKTLGLRQPVLVVPVSAFRAAHAVDLPPQARWVVLAGHRRRAACELAGVAEMPAWVRADLSAEADAAETFLAENVHRRGLSPLEEARAMALLVDLGFSQRQIAERGGFAQSHVSKRLSLLRLPQQVQDALSRAEITVADALAISAMPVDDQVAVYELSRAEGVPLASAVSVLERQRSEAVGRQRARQRAEREGLTFIERPSVAFNGNPGAHRLQSEAEVVAARRAGTLVAGADSVGAFAYFSTMPPGDPGSSEEERERRGANADRAAAAAQLVAGKPSGRQATEELADAVLHDRVPYTESLRLAHKWLGDSVGITGADMYRWRDSITGLDAASRVWVAWAMTAAGAEARLRSRRGRWDVADRAHVQRLVDGVGYVPSEWEKRQLARIDEVSDSDGITIGEER